MATAALAGPPNDPRRLVYLGSPQTAVPALLALMEAGFEIVLVVTQPDKRRGRRADPSPTPVKAAALAAGLRVSHDLADVTEVDADLGVVVAFGEILRRDLLVEVPMINLHFSLLPRWRGAAPVERALLAGDPETGVCVMAVEEGLDTGAVYSCSTVPIPTTITAAELAENLATVGAELLVRTLSGGLGEPTPQEGEPVYAAKLTPAELELDWNRPACELDRFVRVGGAWTTRRGSRVKVHRSVVHPLARPVGEPGALHGDLVTTGEGALQLIEVQPEGKGKLAFPAWVNGARPMPGEILGTDEVAS